MRQLVGAATLLAVLIGIRPGAAQTLGEIATREADRRKQTASGKLYTNNDLRPEPPPRAVDTTVTVINSSVPAPALDMDKQSTQKPSLAAGAAPDTAPYRAKEHRDETYWRTRARELRGQIQRRRDDIAALEMRQLELGEQPDGGPEYDVATDALTKLRRNLDAFTGELARFEERARAAKIPGEWIR